MINVKPTKLVLMWRNDRTGVEVVARRLDRCLVIEDLLLEVGVYQSWVEYPFISYHSPTLLQLEASLNKKSIPFKFNAHCLTDLEFGNLVRATWNDPIFLAEFGFRNRLVWKLNILKEKKQNFGLGRNTKRTSKYLNI